MCIKVIGVDPAPSKNSTIFDGNNFISKDANELKTYLDELKKSTDSVLICWDAPLTGPRNPDDGLLILNNPSDLSQRILEAFFMQNIGMKTPYGISVRPYSGCSHWTITRRLLGLPRVGCYDTPWENLPFQLIASEQHKAVLLKTPGKYVVEVHPAVALWLWLERNKKCNYKKDKKIFEQLCKT